MGAASGLAAGRARSTSKCAVVVEIAVEGLHRAVGDQPQPVGDQFDQMRVVRDQQHRALEIGERADQRLARVDVQMVGRLVEDQQMRRVARGQRQQQPRLLAARQVFDRRLGAVGIEPEAGELRAHLRRRGARQRAGHVVDRRFGGRQLVFLVLREVADAQFRAAPYLALHRLEPAGEQLRQRRLAVAVGAEQRDAVVHVDAQHKAAQDRPAVITDATRGPAPGSAARAAPAPGKLKRVGVSSTTVSICGSRASAFSRACACRALVALARKRSTKVCMCARCSATFSAARACCMARSVRMRTNSS